MVYKKAGAVTTAFNREGIVAIVFYWYACVYWHSLPAV
jgi:hypothetical protein